MFIDTVASHPIAAALVSFAICTAIGKITRSAAILSYMPARKKTVELAVATVNWIGDHGRKEIRS